jgi:PAS domain S-box-containing protein
MKGHFLLANQAAVAALGISSTDDVIGKSDFDFFEPELAEGFLADEQALLKSGESVMNKEDCLIDKQGNKVYLSTTKIPLRDIHGQIIGLIGANHNITERKRAEAQALELGKEREQVKMLSDFIRDVSHDFRTPLATISSSLYLLTRATDSEKQTRYFTNAEGQIKHLTQLIDRLLIMSRLDSQSSLEYQRLDINSLVTDLYAKVNFEAGQKNLTVHHTLYQNSLMVQADPRELSIALWELGKNAIAYSPPNSTITICTRQEANQAVIEISDNGIGISSGESALIFQRLYRVDKARATTGGSGLGLSIAKRIIELHHGRVEVESVVGQGSIFRIFLPLS